MSKVRNSLPRPVPIRISVPCFLLIALCGCQEQILHDLAEYEANRVTSRLHDAKINAEKIVQSDGRWAIAVPREEMVEALAFLDSARVISTRTLNDSSKAKGSFIPSRESQWFQYESSIASSIEGTLTALPGVLDARVHLNLPQTDPLFGMRTQSSGSGSVLMVVDAQYTVADSDISILVAGAAGVAQNNIRVLRTNATSASEKNRALASKDTPLAQATTRFADPVWQIFAWASAVLFLAVTAALSFRSRKKKSPSPFQLQPLFDHEA